MAIDLDGDGIETTAVVNNGIPTLFDHDADGVRTGTGWLHPDDGWLVLDRDGNGSIDSGRELFGVDTIFTATQTGPDGQPQTVTRNATTGFEALQTLDTGTEGAGSAGFGDGNFDASDAQFADVRVWRDINQDGISQTVELQSLADAGIASISLIPTVANINLGNGNTVTGTATVTRSNGSTTLVETVSMQAGNLDLANNPFFRQFNDSVTLTAAARALPEMGGSGLLRDLREAMSLGTPYAAKLVAAVQDSSQASTRTEQQNLMGNVLAAWAQTAPQANMWVRAAASRPVLLSQVFSGATATSLDAESPGWRALWAAADFGPYSLNDAAMELVAIAEARGLIDRIYLYSSSGNIYREPMWMTGAAGYPSIDQLDGVERTIGILQVFNGNDFLNVLPKVSVINMDGVTYYPQLPDQRVTALLSQSYNTLLDSVYSALALQTRLRPYLDAIDLVIDETGIRFDTTALGQLLAYNYSTAPQAGLEDLIDLVRFATPTLQAVGHDALTTLREWVEALPAGSPLLAVADAAGLNLTAGTVGTGQNELIMGDWANNTLAGADGNDVIDAGNGSDSLGGGNGDDYMLGRAGNDTLDGNAGNDTLDGGTGNDTVNGGAGNNLYLFGKGDGQDLIPNFADSTADKISSLRFKEGVLPGEVSVRQVHSSFWGWGADLEFSISGTTDKIVVGGLWGAAGGWGNDYAVVQRIEFADGTVWDYSDLKTLVHGGTAGADVIGGSLGDDTILGHAGNDVLSGSNGNDSLDGGADSDALNGNAGNDTLDGGAGNDSLQGESGNNTYLFGRGDGQDTLAHFIDSTPGKNSVLRFKEGVSPSDVSLKQLYSSFWSWNADIEFALAGTSDKITVASLWRGLSTGDHNYTTVQRVEFADGTAWDYDDLKGLLHGGTAGADVIGGSLGDDTISGHAGNDVLSGSNGNDTLYGGADDDALNGEAGNDTLDGGSGNDTLNGESGDDILDGSAGNDSLQGESGNNTYLFGRGDGQDAVANFLDSTPAKNSVLRFKEGVAPGDVSLKQLYSYYWSSNADIEFAITGTSDKITVAGLWRGLSSGDHGYTTVQRVEFADGTSWDLNAVKSRVFTGTAGVDAISGTTDADVISGQAGNDTLTGAAGDDTLMGDDGADSLNGNAGNDTLDGGAGNDSLQGESGNNTYLFGRGDGQDAVANFLDSTPAKNSVLRFKEGVAPGDVSLKQLYSYYWSSNADIEFAITGTSDKITVAGLWRGLSSGDHGYTTVQRVEFADGTSWDLNAVKSRVFAGTAGADAISGTTGADAISGQAGNDTLTGAAGDDTLMGGDGADSLNGNAGNDTLDGGVGNDSLQGEAGNNTYLFGRGDGQDAVANFLDSTPAKNSVLRFKEGVAPGDVSLKQLYSYYWSSNADIEFAITGTSDKITVAGLWRGLSSGDHGYTTVQRVEFADGTSWDLNAVKSRVFAGTAGADAISGTTGADAISGQAGNDTLTGAAGDDTLMGGDGADSLNGNAGNDTLDGGVGNDSLQGEAGNNTYLFGRGDGQDAVANFLDSTPAKNSVLRFKEGVAPGDVSLKQLYSYYWSSNADIEFAITGTSDKITVAGLWRGLSSGDHGYTTVQRVEFADGTSWDLNAVKSRVFAGTAGADAISGTTGADAISGQAGNDTLTGAAGDDTLMGGDGADSLNGNAGNDALDGGAGNDSLQGESGNNTYLFGRGDGQDSLTHFIDSTPGKNSVLRFKEGVAPSDVSIKQLYSYFWSWNADIEFAIAGSSDKITVASLWRGLSTGDDSYTTVQRVEFADGTSWDLNAVKSRVFAGTAGADTVSGTSGSDGISGQGGNDTLTGAAGDDTLMGGDGADSLNGNSGNDALDGGAGNDILNGESGNDTLDGGTGNDALQGEVGNNTYLFGRGDGQDSIVHFLDSTPGKNSVLLLKPGVLASDVTLRQTYNSAFGWNSDIELSIVGTTDKVTVGALWRLAGGSSGNYTPVQRIEFADSTTWDLAAIRAALFAGTAGADSIAGTDDADAIYGQAGNDSLSGGIGDDTLMGGDGVDSLNGNAGNDTLDGGAGNDSLQGESGNNTYLFGRGDGQDSIVHFLDSTPGKNSVLLLKPGVLASDVTLRQTYNSAFGWNSDIELSIVGTTDKVTVGALWRSVGGWGGNYTPVQRLEFADSTTWDLAAIRAALFAGTASADSIEGTDGADVIYGQAGNDSLNGSSGDDVLDGGSGTDTLVGGAGDDVFVVDAAGDVTTESANGGTDTVRSTVTWTLGTNLENLTLLGTAAIAGTGNASNNALTGNSGANTLTGAAGNDTLDGAGGADTLVGGAGADTYVFGLGWGLDTVQENDATAGVVDQVLFGAGIAQADTSFVRNANNLEVSILNTVDKLVVQNWYLGTQYQVEEFRYADGSTVTNSQVEGLLSAMASFGAPASAVAEPMMSARTTQWRNVDFAVALV